jgi:hypothetical protein
MCGVPGNVECKEGRDTFVIERDSLYGFSSKYFPLVICQDNFYSEFLRMLLDTLCYACTTF